MFLYHQVGLNEAQGESLHPLSQLKTVSAILHEEALEKYKGRELIPDETLPILDCKRSDVIYLSAVPPHVVRNGQRKTGNSVGRKGVSYKIPLQAIDTSRTIIQFYSKQGDIVYMPCTEWYLKKASHIPFKAFEYYRECRRKKEPVFLFHLVPQILYQGSIKLSECTVC